MSPMLEQYRVFARYNRWMNAKLFAAAAELSDDERKEERGAFFRSLHGTFNHLLLTDRVWLSRFGVIEPTSYTDLASELYADFGELRNERAKTDGDLIRYVDSLDDGALGSSLSYTSSRGSASHLLWFAITHLFNHQTHHRGQATTLLSQLGKDVGVTDVITVFRDDHHEAFRG